MKNLLEWILLYRERVRRQNLLYRMENIEYQPMVIFLTVVPQWSNRAVKIVDIMKTASTKVGELSQNADAIRNAALIDLGEKTGLQMTSLANKISFNIGETSDQGNTVSRTLAANTSFFVEKASDFRIAGTRANNTDTLTLDIKEWTE